MPAGGFANINGGVTIDMTGLSSVTINNDHTVVSIGSGAKWLDVYTYLDALDLSVARGRNGLVGVGGLTLGGGISYFAPRVGWACDNVANFEVRENDSLPDPLADDSDCSRIGETDECQRNLSPGALPCFKRWNEQLCHRYCHMTRLA